MPVISNAIDIQRPAGVVFDYVSDMRTEAEWNPVARSVELLSGEPIGVGSRVAAKWKGFGRATMEITDFDPSRSWAARTVEGALPVLLTGRVIAATPQSTRLSVTIELLPTGLMVVFAPVVAAMMGRTAKANLRRIKAAVE